MDVRLVSMTSSTGRRVRVSGEYHTCTSRSCRFASVCSRFARYAVSPFAHPLVLPHCRRRGWNLRSRVSSMDSSPRKKIVSASPPTRRPGGEV